MSRYRHYNPNPIKANASDCVIRMLTLVTGQQNINANTNGGFRDAMINDGINSIRDGIGNLSTQLCGCCSDVQMALANGFAGVEQGANARQIANMQTAFDLSRQFAECLKKIRNKANRIFGFTKFETVGTLVA